MKHFLFLFQLLSVANYAQPDWANKIPTGYLNDYFVGKGTSQISKVDASQKAFEDAIVSIIRNNSITVSLSENNKTISTQTLYSDDSNFEIVRQSAQELRIEGESKTVKNLKEVESYYDDDSGYYTAWVLVNFPKKDPISPPSAYSPVWRSFLLPGWGQLYKEETFKGVSFMLLSLGGAASGFVFSELSKDATNKATSSRTQLRRDFFNNESKNYNTYSTISFISAAVFYIWSLVDAIIVKQDDLYVQLEYQKEFRLAVNFKL